MHQASSRWIVDKRRAVTKIVQASKILLVAIEVSMRERAKASCQNFALKLTLDILLFCPVSSSFPSS
jgi:hypothetical protein